MKFEDIKKGIFNGIGIVIGGGAVIVPFFLIYTWCTRRPNIPDIPVPHAVRLVTDFDYYHFCSTYPALGY